MERSWRLLVMLVVGAVMSVTASCNMNGTDEADDATSYQYEGDAGDESVTFYSPRQIYPGKTVELTAVVDRRLGDHLFRIVGRGSSRPHALVVHPGRSELEEDEFVRVSGAVVRLDLKAVKKIGGDRMDATQLRPYIGDLAIIADEVVSVT